MPRKIMLTADVDEVEKVQEETPKLQNSITSNELYFYSDVTPETSFIINKSLSDLSRQLLITQITFDLPEPPPIRLYINSDGGEVFGALSIIDKIRTCKVPVHSYIEGLAASSATLISVSCHKRFMNKNSVMLIHQVSSWFSGTHENFKDEYKNLEVLMNLLKGIYLKNTNFKESELEELLKHDLYLSANDALKYGLIDEIV